MANNVSVFLCYLLRHHPEEVQLTMDLHGWVDVEQLITGVNTYSKFHLDKEELEEIVAEDNKGRYRFNENHSRIKCCQGHSIPWVEPELVFCAPPEYLYHGTTTVALEKIMASGSVKKMKRHAVHLQEVEEKAWQSAKRWHLVPVILKIDAKAMAADGYEFGVSENRVWCVEEVPMKYICEKIL